MRRVIAVFEQPVDQQLAAIRRSIVEELVRFTNRRNAAGQIEIDTPHKLGVRCGLNRMNAILLPLRSQFVVDTTRKFVVG